jgi:hypothetical protein
MIKDVILENQVLYNEFRSRFKALNIGCDTLVQEMQEDGMVMDKKRLQRFLAHGFRKRITQNAYIWLLMRHGIYIGLKVNGTDFTDEQNRNNAKLFTQ